MNTQQTYGAVDVAAAAPKKLGRKVVVAAAALSLAGAAALSLGPRSAGGASLYGFPWGFAAPPWQPAVPQTPTPIACGPIIGQLKAVPPKGDAGIAYIQNTLMPVCGVPSSGYPAPSAAVYQCPVCITRLAQAAANNDVCAAGAALVTFIAIDTDTSGGIGTAGGAPAHGAGGQASSLLCGMTRGDGVTKAFAHCPSCPGQPLAKTIRYKDEEIPCSACTNALPLTRFLFKDNKLVDNACKQCRK
jgi:hypothetical protein